MADLTTEQLDKLEEIARAATPGPWTNEKPPTEDGWQVGVTIGATRGGMIFARPPSGQMPLADAAHIAAASPDVVLALVAAAKERDFLRTGRPEMGDVMQALALLQAGPSDDLADCVAQLISERDQLRASLTASKAEAGQLRVDRDQLRAEVERLTAERDLWTRDLRADIAEIERKP